MTIYQTPYQKLVQDWCACTKCPLSENRKRVVQYRGPIPCDMAFIGESPGESEDALGAPFKGPAGRLLDDQINSAYDGIQYLVRIGFFNLVACWPKPKDSKKRDPTKKEIMACAPRLKRLAELARPRAIVCVGGLSEKWVPALLGDMVDHIPVSSILHPAWILKLDAARKPMANEKSIAQLTDAFQELLALMRR